MSAWGGDGRNHMSEKFYVSNQCRYTLIYNCSVKQISKLHRREILAL